MDDKYVNPNDFKVVEFFNSTDFDFTPELGAMYDGRPLFVGTGERRQFPYHVGHRLAENLAKAVMVKGAPLHDPNAINPTGTALWSEEKLQSVKNSFLRELYMEEKPIAQSETDRLMTRVDELEKLFEKEQADKAQKGEPLREPTQTVQEIVASKPSTEEADKAVKPKIYRDKQEVIAELEKRGISHDKRFNKRVLERLLR
jgi:hypothetical protein